MGEMAILKLLQKRYFLESETTWEQLAERVTTIYPQIRDNIIKKWFIPSSPTLMNGGTDERLGTLSSCFPMGIEDSIKGIYGSLLEGAIVTQYGGGIGYEFSSLRSSKEDIKTLKAKSSGPMGFIPQFSVMLEGIKQGGKRRGAGMGILHIEHPDILDFITAKDNISQITHINLSVKIPNSFYDTLKNAPNTIHKVRTKDGIYFDLTDDKGKTVTVKQLWDKIIDAAWKSAEPGIFNETIAFDRCTVTNIDKTVIANPCSEFVNIPYTSCSLGSINLLAMLDGKKFNWERYSELIGLATRFIDRTIDINNFPLEKIKKITQQTRPIGLGNMGLAHVLFKKEIPYNSEKAFKFAEEVNRYETLRSMQESVEMAKEFIYTSKVCNYEFEIDPSDPRAEKRPRGSYPAFDYDLFMKANARFFTKNCKEIDVKKLAEDIKKYGIRNSSFTSIAPTGSISFIADVSSGMEPVFGLAYYRKIEQITKEKEYDSVYMSDPIFEEYLDKNFDEKTKLKILSEVADNNGSCQICKDIPEDMRKVFVTATDLTPKEHLYILEAVANNVSLSVSKTINLPATIDKKEISDVFLDAHDKGIIGVTVYREGSREGILVHNDTQINGPSITSIIERNAPKRPKDLPCEIHRVMYQGKTWIVFVGMYEDRPFEVFAGAVEDVNIPKSITTGNIIKQKSHHYSFVYDDEIIVDNIGKTFANKEHDAFARVISQELRHFIPLKFIVDVLNKSEGGITHFSKVIARTLKKYIPDGEDAGKCQQCGSKLVYFEGCMKCSNLECGFSKCG